MAARKRAAAKIYELHIQLAGIEPPIWRRLLVPATITLPELHEVLQLAMGWTNSHLHSFEFGDRAFSSTDAEFEELCMLDEAEYTLETALADYRKFVYEYDFGDSWHHHIKVQSVLHPNPDLPYPLCVAGARAAPPEEVGGVRGYKEFLSAISDPTHDERDRMLIWAGGAFDPEGFDLNAINRTLRLGRP
jgi:hypothetical protein